MQNITQNCATLLVNGNGTANRLTSAAQGVHPGLFSAGTMRPELRSPVGCRSVGKRPGSGSPVVLSSERLPASERWEELWSLYRGDSVKPVTIAKPVDADAVKRGSDTAGVGLATVAMRAGTAAAGRAPARAQKPSAALPAPIWAAFVLSRALSG